MKTTILNSNKNDYNFDSTFKFVTTTKTPKNYVDSLLDKAYKEFLPWKFTKKGDVNYLSIPKIETDDYSIMFISPSMLNLEWNKAATKLKELAYYTKNKSYDFLIGDVPVKIHGNYIQVGYDIIPTFTKSSFFDDYSDEDRATLYEISLSINILNIA